jgi:hypothetical protein
LCKEFLAPSGGISRALTLKLLSLNRQNVKSGGAATPKQVKNANFDAEPSIGG